MKEKKQKKSSKVYEKPLIVKYKEMTFPGDISSKVYEKPLIVKYKEMTFPGDIIRKLNSDSRLCLQCSSCHGCR